MAEEHPPSPAREDDSLPLRRLRVKPAMTDKSNGSKKTTIQQFNNQQFNIQTWKRKKN